MMRDITFVNIDEHADEAEQLIGRITASMRSFRDDSVEWDTRMRHLYEMDGLADDLSDVLGRLSKFFRMVNG
jgi:hypothetical protein